MDYFNSGTAAFFEAEPYRRILSAIGEGQENAVHLSELIRISGITDRELRKTIEYIRRQGIVILSGNSGYYFPADEAELKAFVRREEHRAKSIIVTLRPAKRYLYRFK